MQQKKNGRPVIIGLILLSSISSQLLLSALLSSCPSDVLMTALQIHHGDLIMNSSFVKRVFLVLISTGSVRLTYVIASKAGFADCPRAVFYWLAFYGARRFGHENLMFERFRAGEPFAIYWRMHTFSISRT